MSWRQRDESLRAISKPSCERTAENAAVEKLEMGGAADL